MECNEKLQFKAPVRDARRRRARFIDSSRINNTPRNQSLRDFHFNWENPSASLQQLNCYPTKPMDDEIQRNQQGAMCHCHTLLPPSEGVSNSARATNIRLQSLMAALIRRIKVTLRPFACSRHALIWWHTNVMMETAIGRRKGFVWGWWKWYWRWWGG